MSAMKRLTGLFLGAGASFEAGMPLVWELTSEIKSWLTADKIRELNALWRAHRGGYSDSVVDDFISVLTRSDVHYEGILGHLETQFRRQRNLPQEYYGLYSWLVELVYYLLYVRQINNNTFLNQQLPRYDGLRALAEANTPLWIYTVNHDVNVEILAARLSIPLHTGFSASKVTLPRRDTRGKKKGEIRAEILTKNELENGAMYFPNPPQPGIYLMKIHGALDVFTFNEGQDLLKLCPNGSKWEEVIEVLRATNEDLFYRLPGAPGGKAKAINEIAYADDQGVMQFLRRSLLAGGYKFDTRGTQVLPQSMLKHFRQNLNFVSTLICIGYSFGDRHINDALREWLELSPDRRLEIVRPNTQEVPREFLHLISQVATIKSDATDYLDSRAGIVRSPHETRQKRLVSVLRSLGKEKASQAISTFTNENVTRLSQKFLAKLQKLPMVDGKPDFSGINDPAALAKQWAAEIIPSKEELFDKLLKSVEPEKC